MFVTHGLSVVAIFWIAIVAIVFCGSFFSYRERASRHRMIEKLAEKGQTIPPELLMGNGRGYDGYRGWRYGNSLTSGLYLMCVGVALALFFWALTGGYNYFGSNDVFGGDHVPNWLPVIGIFPFMLGFARVLAWVFDRPRSK
jgi:Domain of unknown function (DUF6249)